MLKVDYFRKKSSILAVRQGSEYASETHLADTMDIFFNVIFRDNTTFAPWVSPCKLWEKTKQNTLLFYYNTFSLDLNICFFIFAMP